MTIATNDMIDKTSTEDAVTTGTPGSIANNSFSMASDGALWMLSLSNRNAGAQRLSESR